MPNIYERTRAKLAALDKARAAAERKASEPQRRSDAARMSAAARRDERDDAIASGELEPRNERERTIQTRAMLLDLGIDL